MSLDTFETDTPAVETEQATEPKPDKADTKRTRPRAGSGGGRGRKRGVPNTDTIRSTIDRYESISALDVAERDILAAVFDCANTPTDLTVASITSRADASVIDIIDTIASADDLDAVIEAAALAENKPNLRLAWRLCGADADHAPLRSPVTRAAASLVRLVRGMDTDRLTTMRSALSAVR